MNNLNDFMFDNIDSDYDEFDMLVDQAIEEAEYDYDEVLESTTIGDINKLKKNANKIMKSDPNNKDDAINAGVFSIKLEEIAEVAYKNGDKKLVTEIGSIHDMIVDKFSREIKTPNGGKKNYFIYAKKHPDLKAIEEAEYDDIDALLESIENDYDEDDIATEEFASATKTVASVPAMINAGFSKDKAIKHVRALVNYLDKHNMMAAKFDDINQSTIITRKHLTGDGIQFIKHYYEKFEDMKHLDDKKLKGRLDGALKEYASNSNKIDTICTTICTILSCNIFAIPLLIIYFGFGGSKKSYNKHFNLDQNTALESAEDDLDDILFEDDDDYDDDMLDSATESAMFLDMMCESCESIEEFEALVTENAVEWALYGLIDDADEALEATKVMRVDNWKEKNRMRLIRRESIRIAKNKNDPNYKKYKTFRDKMREFRQKIFDKWDSLATKNVKNARRNASQKAANINTTSGRDTAKRLTNDHHNINSAMKDSRKGKNPTNAPKKSPAA